MFSTRRLEERIFALEKLCAELMNARSNATLQATIDDLRGAIDVLRASNRKEFSSLWGRLGGRPVRTIDAEGIEMPQGNSQFEALLELQSKPPVSPQ